MWQPLLVVGRQGRRSCRGHSSIWLVYIRLQRFSFSFPLVVVAIHALVFVATMITLKLPARVSRNPWFWLLTFVETYWVVLVFAVMSRGRPVAPRWVTDSLAVLSGLILNWARLSLGRSIRLVPASRSLVTHGAYQYVRHPIYSAYCLSFIAALLSAYSHKNLTLFALGIFWFVLKSVAEESFLRSDPRYADYL